jgi:alkylation response protein AidB-like acyl-CoA dehydrogenase
VAAGEPARRLLDAALDRGALAVSAQLLGIAQRLVDEAVAYARKREQFGQAIGSFQAIKHMLASVQVKIEFARPLVYRAAVSVARSVPTRAVDVSQAKSAAGDAALLAARTALQVHGAIGYTWEVDLHLWMKRAWALEGAWGSRLWHRRRIASAVLDGDGPPPSFGFTARIEPQSSGEPS